jgi:Ca-activated chloride channel family protein
MRTTLLAALLLAVLAPAHAQIVLNPPRDASVFSVDAKLVNVLCTVRDRDGAFVKDLTKEDFQIREDGRPQEISHFAREVDTPLTVILMIDVSGSVSRIIGIEKAAAARFFSEVLRPGDKAAVVGFAQMIAVWQDFTASVELLEGAIDQAGPFVLGRLPEFRPRGGTLLYDAVNLVATHKLKKQTGRKTMVVITDGHDNGSLVNLDTANKAAQEADAVIYAIHYEDASQFRHGEATGMAALEKLSEPTGGRAFDVSDKLPLEKIFDTIGEEMRSQYGLGYRPSNEALDGTFRRLEVKTSKSGLQIRTRSGYYAIKR